MRPIEFKGHNCVYAKDQPEYLPLSVYKSDDGMVTSCWKLTLKDRIKLLISGNLWIQNLTFNQKLQPIKPSVDCPLT